jgi:signal transduction histidine kinase
VQLSDENEQRGVLRQADVLLGRLGPFAATVVLTLAAVIAALGTLLVIAALGGPRVTSTVVITATTVTVVVAAPIVRYSQHLIHRLRLSRRSLKNVLSELAIAVERAEHANRSKSEFLANVSHELRTPLNAIIGFSEMIRDQHIGPVGNSRYLAYAEDIRTSGQHLLRIINDILDLSKIEAGRMSLDAAEFDVRGAIETAIRIVRPIAERARVVLTLDEPPAGVRLFGAERMLKQILINIVTNSVKFTPEGGSVRVAGVVRPDGCLVLTVRDTGAGMTQDEIAHALVPFGQIDSAMNRKHRGTGLGLPLSKAMVELHDGTLLIQSAPRQGTLVSITFPAKRVVMAEDSLRTAS